MKFSMQGLATAGLDLVPPIVLEVMLDPGDDVDEVQEVELTFSQVARVLPGRRMSGLARYRGDMVFAKVFYGAQARRYWQRELAGARLLAGAGVCTPALQGQGSSADGGYVVFYQPFPDAVPVQPEDSDDVLAAVELLAQLHEHELLQSDVHLNNFVKSGGEVYAVDADGLRTGQTLQKQLDNLGMLLAQRPPLYDREVSKAWRVYSDRRGGHVGGTNSADIGRIAVTQRRYRVRRYLEKTQRECTEFIHRKTFTREFVCDRRHWPRLQRLLLLPELVIGEGTPLKLGNSATVIRVEIEGERYVVKRYNIKGIVHRVRRWFKRRARNAWKNGHWLAFLKIPTACPIALIEHRFGWFTGVCYLVMPDCGDLNLGEAVLNQPQRFDHYRDRAVRILKMLAAAGLEHGDLKATNLVLADDEILLIDYDAVRTGNHAKDIKRFLANWDDHPRLRQQWQDALDAENL